MRALLVLVGSLLGAVLLAAPAAAHPLDETVQQLFVTPARSGLTVQLDISPNVLVAPAFVSAVDVDGDGVLSPSETGAHAELVRHHLVVEADGVRLPLRLTDQRYPPAPLLAAGGGTITLTWAADLPGGARRLAVHDAYDPAPTVVQAGVLVPSDPVPVGDIAHADGGRTLTARLNDAATAAPAPAAPAGSSGNPMLEALRRPLAGPWALVALLAVCTLLGALHALGPGHGKALLAAHLVGTGATPWRAVHLGAVLTVTHTATVLALGLVLLAAAPWVIPDAVTPVLATVAGVVVLVVGLRRLVRRRPPTGHGHGHRHGHRRPRGSLALGVAAGLIPCPEALGVLLLAVGVGRTALGLGMLVAFSAGLAAVLVGLGLVLVVAGTRLARGTGSRLRRAAVCLPLASAVVVAVVGAGMVVSGLSTLVRW
ncbi:hypothetical protein [Actinomycetospora flava]|uniref:ABC-type nickel/cobalt efflux system permease component RcnA n=1 Tax=Actinomycetospora flava TaxID=3129232 RepID=A0ABU8MCX9_9PSEU